MNTKSLKTAYELEDMIVEQAILLQGPWPMGMTLCLWVDRQYQPTEFGGR